MIDRSIDFYKGLPDDVTLDVQTYKLHWPPEVRALWGVTEINERFAMARDLEARGFFIDLNTHVYWMDPVLFMQQMRLLGLTWVGPAHLGGEIGDGGSGSGAVPAGYEKVSVRAEDFPPFDPPVITAPATNIVGKVTYPGVYGVGPGWKGPDGITPAVRDGQRVMQDGVAYIAHVYNTLMGWGGWFSLA